MALSTPISVGGGHAADAVARQLKGGRRDVRGVLFRTVLQLALGLAILILVVLLVDVVTGGWTVFDHRFHGFMSSGLRTRAEDAGVFQGLRGSFWICIFVVVLAFPIGIGAALYLEEYAPRTRFTRFVNLNIRNLAGVPSVVYGILGLAIFVKSLRGLTGGQTVMAGGITLAILVLPIVVITASEAIRAVPQGLREAGYGVGATRWEVTRHHVLPYAAPGVLTGTVLALARALGEAAPLILVGAIGERLASQDGLLDVGQLRERFTAMPIVIAEWSKNTRPGFDEVAAAAIVVMLIAVLAANTVAILLRNRFEKRRR
jgi:phosphate transport system permease protein